MNKLLVLREGMVLKGRHAECEVSLIDDKENTGGYLIVIQDTGRGETFDSWFETIEDANRQLCSLEWVIKWNDGKLSTDP